MRGAHRRGRARVGPGRELRRAPRARSRAAAGVAQRDARARDRRARRGARARRVRRRRRRDVAAATATRSSTGPCPTRSSPASRGGSRAARPARRCGSPPTRSSASTTSRRSAGKADRRAAPRPSGGCSSRAGSTSATGVLRYEVRGERVLLADGAVDRRHAGRGRARASAGPATCWRSCAAEDRAAAGRWPRRGSLPLGSRLLRSRSARQPEPPATGRLWRGRSPTGVVVRELWLRRRAGLHDGVVGGRHCLERSCRASTVDSTVAGASRRSFRPL